MEQITISEDLVAAVGATGKPYIVSLSGKNGVAVEMLGGPATSME